MYPKKINLVEALELINTAALEMARSQSQKTKDLEMVYALLTDLNKRVEEYELERVKLFSALEHSESEAKYYLENLKAAEEELIELKSAVSRYIKDVALTRGY